MFHLITASFNTHTHTLIGAHVVPLTRQKTLPQGGMLTVTAGCFRGFCRAQTNFADLRRRRKMKELLSESGVQLAGFAREGSVTAGGKLELLIILLIVC